MPLQERLEGLRRLLESRGVDPQLAGRQALELIDREVDRQAALLAYDDLFKLLALMFLAAIPLVLLLRRPRSVLSEGGAR